MKILHVFDILSQRHGGGTVPVLRSLVTTLKQRGHEVAIYASDYGIEDGDMLSGVEIKLSHCVSRFGGQYYTPIVKETARRELSKFDIIHMHCFRSYQNAVISNYARLYNIPYIIDAHGSFLRINKQFSPKWILKYLYDLKDGYRMIKYCSQFIAESNVGFREYKSYKINGNKIDIIHPPIDIKKYELLPEKGLFRKKYNLEQKKIILCMSRLHWAKKQERLIKALDYINLSYSYNGFILVLAGVDNGYKGTLEKLITKYKLEDQVIFVGYVSGSEKLSIMVDADVLAQVSDYEQGAQLPLESILCGTPVVLSRYSGAGQIMEVIGGAYPINCGCEHELARAIFLAANNTRELRDEVIKAKDYVRNKLNPDYVVSKYEDMYKRVLGCDE